MDTAKSIDCILNLLSDIITLPVKPIYIIEYKNFQYSVKFGFAK